MARHAEYIAEANLGFRSSKLNMNVSIGHPKNITYLVMYRYVHEYGYATT
jgi:hypothetical protein